MKKNIYICYLESSPAHPSYLDQIYAGIKRKVSSRRETVLSVTTDEEALAACAKWEVRCIILLLSDRALCEHAFQTLSAHGIHVIMANIGIAGTCGTYSLVEADYEGTAYRLTTKLLSSGGQRPVFLGFNPKSYHDALRLRGAHAACAEHNLSCQIIENRGDITAAADAFLLRRKEFDTIICSNDFITYSLLSAAPDIKDTPIASLGGHMTFAHDTILSARIDYEQLGAHIVDTYLLLEKSAFSISITLRIPALIDKSTSKLPLHGKMPADNFYQDKTVDLIERIQRIRSGADDIDSAIFERLKQGMTYERIADELYLSVRTIKNRAKKMFDLLGCRTKKEFLLFIRSCP
ncbi:MAG: hypothetical protein IJC15_08895 [Clostridia bacterium]|nr:hypothetical protein [Clostridia bacterium]